MSEWVDINDSTPVSDTLDANNLSRAIYVVLDDVGYSHIAKWGSNKFEFVTPLIYHHEIRFWLCINDLKRWHDIDDKKYRPKTSTEVLARLTRNKLPDDAGSSLLDEIYDEIDNNFYDTAVWYQQGKLLKPTNPDPRFTITHWVSLPRRIKGIHR